MSILRWILATALAISFLLLAVANWTPVPFRLPDGAMINVRLPILLGLAFVAGWLPTWLIHLGSKATWKRKLARTGALENRTTPPVSTPPAGL
jgi:putative membrane protein